MQWNEYTGGTWPAETTHLQLADGQVYTVQDAGNLSAPQAVLRYFGPAPVSFENAVAVIPPILPADYADVAARCVAALMRGDFVTITHPEGYERCGLGIPLKRGQPTGGLTHEYRPIVILEWLADQIPKSY